MRNTTNYHCHASNVNATTSTESLNDDLCNHASCQIGKSLSEQQTQTQYLSDNSIDCGTSVNVSMLSRDIIQFLTKTAPVVLEELYLPKPSPSLLERNHKKDNVKLMITFECPPNLSGLEVTGIDWSASGKLLAVSYGKLNLSESWTDIKGGLALFDTSNRSLMGSRRDAQFLVEHTCYIMCVAAHPEHCSIFAFGDHNGQVLLCDFNKEIPFISNSRLDKYSHNDAIVSIKWKQLSNDEWVIVSLCANGKLLIWSPLNLRHPLQGHHLEGPPNSEDENIVGLVSLGGSVFTIFDNGMCIVGTESGCLINIGVIGQLLPENASACTSLKWSTNAMRAVGRVPCDKLNDVIKRIEAVAIKDKKRGVDLATVYSSRIDPHTLFPSSFVQSFKPHIGQITAIDFHPKEEDIFVTSGIDGELRLYEYSSRKPKTVISPSKQTTAYPIIPLLDVSFNGTGSVRIFENTKCLIMLYHFFLHL